MSEVQFDRARILIDGNEVQIVSGAMHYFRAHEALWRDRLEKAVLMGLNCIETYLPWNLHEPEEGTFDFHGILDVERFIRLAAELGLYVIVRPGPYICAEWDNGGLPAWLMTKPEIRFRRTNRPYLDAVERYFAVLLPKLRSLQYDQGGPIIMIQLENEYGSYSHDRNYLEELLKLYSKHGISVPSFTADGDSPFFLGNGMMPGVPAFLTGGSALANGVELIRQLRPEDPPFYMEFWCGWFNAWGKRQGQERSVEEIAGELDDLLSAGGHVNIYLFHGGSNFGFNAGANCFHGVYTGDTSSYDYGAPLSECGDPTPLFFAFREVIRKYRAGVSHEVPPPVRKIAYGKIAYQATAPLFDNLERLSQPIAVVSPEPMEFYGQNNGFILYRTRLEDPMRTSLSLPGVHDRAQVFFDGRQVAVLDRNDAKPEIESVEIPESGLTVDLLIESFGHINYGPQLGLDFKGLTQDVLTGGQICRCNWQVYPLPMNQLDGIHWQEFKPVFTGPAFHRAEFEVTECADTFLAFPGVCGVVWVNGFLLGRYWTRGPEKTLYIPSPLLRMGNNELVVFETEGLNAPFLRLTTREPRES